MAIFSHKKHKTNKLCKQILNKIAILNISNQIKEVKGMKKENELQKIESLMEIDRVIEPNSKEFEKLMFIYKIAIKEINTKLEILKEEAKLFYNYDLIDHINTRIKSPESITNKMKDKSLQYTYKEMIKNINDIAGIRAICPIQKDIYTIRNLISKIPGVKVLKEKDYVRNPKKVDILVII